VRRRGNRRARKHSPRYIQPVVFRWIPRSSPCILPIALVCSLRGIYNRLYFGSRPSFLGLRCDHACCVPRCAALPRRFCCHAQPRPKTGLCVRAKAGQSQETSLCVRAKADPNTDKQRPPAEPGARARGTEESEAAEGNPDQPEPQGATPIAQGNPTQDEGATKASPLQRQAGAEEPGARGKTHGGEGGAEGTESEGIEQAGHRVSPSLLVPPENHRPKGSARGCNTDSRRREWTVTRIDGGHAMWYCGGKTSGRHRER
jgi:hypothetical protein